MPLLKVKQNEKVAHQTYHLILQTTTYHAPGQFVELKVSPTNDPFIRRPMSVADYDQGELSIIYKVFGRGTEMLTHINPGDYIDCLEGLGHGFDIDAIPDDAILLGGGIGIPPLYYLGEALKRKHKRFSYYFGYQNENDIFYQQAFENLAPLTIATMDGTKGHQGSILDCLTPNQYVISVGPMGMLKALSTLTTKGQVSLEERMGCGFGACMGCSIKTKQGPKRVCVEGPVFFMEDLLWETL